MDSQTTTPADPPPADPPPAATAPEKPTQAELDKDRKPLSKEEAELLLRSGTRLRLWGDDPENWITMTRHLGAYCISHAATDEAMASLLETKLLIA